MGDFRGVSQERGTLYLMGRCNSPEGFLIPNSQKIMTSHILQLEHINTGQLLPWRRAGEHTGRESTADSSQRWNQSNWVQTFLFMLSFLAMAMFLITWADCICNLLRSELLQSNTVWPPRAMLGDVQSCVTDDTSAHFIVWRALFAACASNIQHINTCLYLTLVFCSSFVH